MPEWFRNTSWSPEIEVQFFAHLKRSRSQRAQYLKIQAGTLASTEPRVALRLIELYFASGDEFFMSDALNVQAEAFVALGLIDEAINSYRRSLQWEETHRGSITGARFKLPLLVATHGKRELYDLVVEILQAPGLHMVFPVEVFAYSSALAIVYAERGNAELALRHAEQALKMADTKKSQLSRHPGLGLVKSEHAPMVERMRSLIANGGADKPKSDGFAGKVRRVLRLH